MFKGLFVRSRNCGDSEAAKLALVGRMLISDESEFCDILLIYACSNRDAPDCDIGGCSKPDEFSLLVLSCCTGTSVISGDRLTSDVSTGEVGQGDIHSISVLAALLALLVESYFLLFSVVRRSRLSLKSS